MSARTWVDLALGTPSKGKRAPSIPTEFKTHAGAEITAKLVLEELLQSALLHDQPELSHKSNNRVGIIRVVGLDQHFRFLRLTAS
jgi:hypothetical protein